MFLPITSLCIKGKDQDVHVAKCDGVLLHSMFPINTMRQSSTYCTSFYLNQVRLYKEHDQTFSVYLLCFQWFSAFPLSPSVQHPPPGCCHPWLPGSQGKCPWQRCGWPGAGHILLTKWTTATKTTLAQSSRDNTTLTAILLTSASPTGINSTD